MKNMSVENYTSLLCFQSAVVVLSLLTFLFTLRVTSLFKAIHGNCKFFLMCIAFGQFCILLCHIFKIAFWFSIDNYDRRFMYAQVFFKTVQPLNEYGAFLTDLNNFMLIMERTIACTRLRSYEDAGTHWAIIISAEALCIAASAYCAYLVHFAGLVVECCAIGMSVELISLVLLLLCNFYSKRAYDGLQDVRSRYQMREVEYVTRALFPSCLVTVLLRAFVTILALFATIFAAVFPEYMVVMAVYHCVQTINSAQYGIVIIFIHENMRLKSIAIIRSFLRRRKTTRTARISDIDKRTETHGEAYFDQLKNAWD